MRPFVQTNADAGRTGVVGVLNELLEDPDAFGIAADQPMQTTCQLLPLTRDDLPNPTPTHRCSQSLMHSVRKSPRRRTHTPIEWSKSSNRRVPKRKSAKGSLAC